MKWNINNIQWYSLTNPIGIDQSVLLLLLTVIRWRWHCVDRWWHWWRYQMTIVVPLLMTLLLLHCVVVILLWPFSSWNPSVPAFSFTFVCLRFRSHLWSRSLDPLVHVRLRSSVWSPHVSFLVPRSSRSSHFSRLQSDFSPLFPLTVPLCISFHVSSSLVFYLTVWFISFDSWCYWNSLSVFDHVTFIECINVVADNCTLRLASNNIICSILLMMIFI